jgi:hypothetical protein
MRWLLTLTLAALVVPAYAGENEAEKLFRLMEKKVKGAQTIQIRCDMVTTIVANECKFKGYAAFGDADKVRLDAEGANAGIIIIKVSWIGNGTKMHLIDHREGQTRVGDSPKGLGGNLRAALPCIGLFGCFEAIADDAFKLSDFKLGAKEKIGNADTRVVEYNIFRGKDKATGKVWINTKTNLPAKLQIAGSKVAVMDAFAEYTETYTEYTIDGKLDAKLFEAPK